VPWQWLPEKKARAKKQKHAQTDPNTAYLHHIPVKAEWEKPDLFPRVAKLSRLQ